MNNKFFTLLEEFLSCECGDYEIKYSWQWIEDANCCEVEISKYDYTACVNFRFNEDTKDLEIEVEEDIWEITREYDDTVKFFWMVVAPALFPNRSQKT